MEKTEKKILISGASIAGPCLAYWLNRAGYATTVIERAPKFRDGGQNIDISGAGKEIVARMGLTEAVKEKNTTEQGLRFVDEAGETVAEFPQDGDASFTRELEIRRGDLARIFYEATLGKTKYRFGLSVKTISDFGTAARVEFSDGSAEDFALVVSAEGLGSPTRKLMMNEFVKIKYLGVWMAYFCIPKLANDDRWARWYNAPGGRVILLRPSTSKTMSVGLDFRSDNPNVDHQPLAEQREKIRAVLQGMGWESDRIAGALDFDDDLYLGPVSQVKASRWSKGRFGLVGDAAYGPSPVTGMGTTLAIIGAYVLAGEIAEHGAEPEAFAAYEKRLRPYVEKSQKLPPGVPLLAHPTTRIGVALLNGAAAAVASRPARAIKKLFAAKKSPAREDTADFALPKYRFEAGTQNSRR